MKPGHLTTLPSGSVPPVDTNSCSSTLDCISLQAGASVIVAIAVIDVTALLVRRWRHMFVTRQKHTGRESKMFAWSRPHLVQQRSYAQS